MTPPFVPPGLRNVEIVEGGINPPTPQPDFQKFLRSIIASPLYQKVLIQSVASAEVNVAFTSCMGALILASCGQPNIPVIQAGIDSLLLAMTVEPTDVVELTQLLTESHLLGVITIPSP